MPVVLILVVRASIALYTSVATQVSLEVAAPTPIDPLPSTTEAQALVVHMVSCWQSVVDILLKAPITKENSLPLRHLTSQTSDITGIQKVNYLLYVHPFESPPLYD